MSENKNELARKLGLGAVIALGVGTTVGSGIFSSLSISIHYRRIASDSIKLCIFGISICLSRGWWTICLLP